MFSTISEYIFGKSTEGVSDETQTEPLEVSPAQEAKDLQISQFQQLEEEPQPEQPQQCLSVSVTSETLAEEWEVVSMQEVEEEQKSINALDLGSSNNVEIEEAIDAVRAEELARENYLIENPCLDVTNTFGRPTVKKDANDRRPQTKSSKRRLVKSKRDNTNTSSINAQLRLLDQHKLQLSHHHPCIPPPQPDHHNHGNGYGKHGKRGGKCRNDNYHYTRKSNVNNDRKCGKMQY